MQKLKRLKVSEIKLDAKNANKGTKRGREFIEGSLKKYGLGRSILLDKDGSVIAGNKTLEAFRKSGGKEIVVVGSRGDQLIAVQREDLTINSKTGRSLAIADNRASELDLEWDAEVLASLDLKMDDLFKDSDLRKILGDLAPEIEAPEPQLDKAEKLRKKWKTARGQIWEIGAHRLMCGSATSSKDHEAVLDGAGIDAVLTDPPYGVGIEYGEFVDTVENVKLLIGEFLPLCRKWPIVAVTTGHRCLWDYPRPTWLLGWALSRATGNGPWGFTCYHPIPVYGADPYLKEKLGGRPDTAVELSADREGVKGHPTVKPIAWWNWLVERVTTKPGRHILDVFGGSGTTLVACEILGRVGYAIELEPKYVAVALERLSEMGLKPELTNRV